MTDYQGRGYDRREMRVSSHSINSHKGELSMICLGIDVSKDKHDCCILSQDGELLSKPFSVPNSRQGFEKLFSLVSSFENNPENVKAGLEATGHYSFAILGYLLEKGVTCFVFNPLHTNLYSELYCVLSDTFDISHVCITNLDRNEV